MPSNSNAWEPLSRKQTCTCSHACREKVVRVIPRYLQFKECKEMSFYKKFAEDYRFAHDCSEVVVTAIITAVLYLLLAS